MAEANMPPMSIRIPILVDLLKLSEIHPLEKGHMSKRLPVLRHLVLGHDEQLRGDVIFYTAT